MSSIRPAGKVFVAAALAAERPPAHIDWTDATQDAQLGLAHPNNHNSQLPIPNDQPLPNSNAQLPIPSFLLGVIDVWGLGVGSGWSLEIGSWELNEKVPSQSSTGAGG